MRDLELRLALVCYGGASLAVYMNGISMEILKLVRASKAIYDPHKAPQDCLEKYPGKDTESLYLELLQAVSGSVKLRIIVDVISGASAGGINGIFLARALAHDLSLSPLRTMWLSLGDVTKLMDDDTLAAKSSKFYLYPLIWLMKGRLERLSEGDQETQTKLSRFVRSRWFRPPFSGRTMLNWMIDAGKNQRSPDNTGHDSLLPPGHKLDLFVTVTNFYGQSRELTLHDPARVRENQHGLILNFSYVQSTSGEQLSDLDDDNIPALGFAARATSSFPGAFPPVTLGQLEEKLQDDGMNWPMRSMFLKKNFPQQYEYRDSLYSMSFLDGGVTNNKPFKAAIRAIYDQPAHREVDRRIIYVDPVPENPNVSPGAISPSPPAFFRTILSSLAEIPRREPIYGDLSDIERQNRLARRQDLVLETVEQEVNAHVDKLLSVSASKKIDTALLATWREQSHKMAYEAAGYSYGAYAHTKAVHLLEQFADLITGLCKAKDTTVSQSQVRATALAWAKESGLMLQYTDTTSTRQERDASFQARVLMFRGLDVDFRIRRVRFVIARLNRYLQKTISATERSSIAALKRVFYKTLERCMVCWQLDFFESIQIDADAVAGGSTTAVHEALKAIKDHMDLESLDFDLDLALAHTLKTIMDQDVRTELFRAYVGFAFHDVVTLPFSVQTDLIENEEVRVDRISPVDCADIAGGKYMEPLMGTRLYNFGAFFSRRARENDYLWGRIHAASRLVDFLVSSAGEEALPSGFDVNDFKRRLYLSILETEAQHSERIDDILANLRQHFSS